MPCSGPRHLPRMNFCFSADAPAARADSAVTVMNAFSVGLSFSMRARQSFVSSTGETFRLRSSWDESRESDCKQSLRSFAVRILQPVEANYAKLALSLVSNESIIFLYSSGEVRETPWRR